MQVSDIPIATQEPTLKAVILQSLIFILAVFSEHVCMLLKVLLDYLIK